MFQVERIIRSQTNSSHASGIHEMTASSHYDLWWVAGLREWKSLALSDPFCIPRAMHADYYCAHGPAPTLKVGEFIFSRR